MAVKPVSEKSKLVLDYLQANPDENLTSEDIGVALGMTKKSVDGIVTSGLIRNKGLVERIPAEMEMPDGTHKAINLIKLTEAGRNYDHASAVNAWEAEQSAQSAE
jgi:hypothetical protein